MTDQLNKYRLLSDLLLSGGVIATLGGILGAYLLVTPFGFGMAVQILSHMMTIIGPGVIKVGYVMRLAAEHAQNHPDMG